jgi:hypothetical protein
MADNSMVQPLNAQRDARTEMTRRQSRPLIDANCYLLLVLTSITTAANTIISTFRLGEMPIRYLKAGEELTKLLYSYRAEAARIHDDAHWKPFEMKTRMAYRAIWAEVTTAGKAPPDPQAPAPTTPVQPSTAEESTTA